MPKKEPLVVGQVAIDIAVMANKMDNIQCDVASVKTDIKDIKESMEADYISRVEFNPIQKIVYGMVGLVLLAVLGALVSLVVLK